MNGFMSTETVKWSLIATAIFLAGCQKSPTVGVEVANCQVKLNISCWDDGLRLKAFGQTGQCENYKASFTHHVSGVSDSTHQILLNYGPDLSYEKLIEAPVIEETENCTVFYDDNKADMLYGSKNVYSYSNRAKQLIRLSHPWAETDHRMEEYVFMLQTHPQASVSLNGEAVQTANGLAEIHLNLGDWFLDQPAVELNAYLLAGRLSVEEIKKQNQEQRKSRSAMIEKFKYEHLVKIRKPIRIEFNDGTVLEPEIQVTADRESAKVLLERRLRRIELGDGLGGRQNDSLPDTWVFHEQRQNEQISMWAKNSPQYRLEKSMAGTLKPGSLHFEPESATPAEATHYAKLTFGEFVRDGKTCSYMGGTTFQKMHETVAAVFDARSGEMMTEITLPPGKSPKCSSSMIVTDQDWSRDQKTSGISHEDVMQAFAVMASE